MQEIIADREGFITADNFKIYWEYIGKGDKEVVCLLNGIAMYTKSWYQTLPNLLEDFDVLLFDYPGQGASSRDDVPYNMERFCDYLSMIMDINKINKIHITGISYGGFVAFEFARLYKERVHSVTISGAIVTYEKLYDLNRKNSLLILQNAPFEIFPSLLYERIFGEEFYNKVEPYIESMKGKLFERYKDYVYCLKRLLQTQDNYLDNIKNKCGEYKKIEAPILVIYGEQDTLVPPWQQKKIKTIIKKCKIIPVPRCAHMVYLERPDYFFVNMKNFMRSKSISFKVIKPD